MLSLRASWRRQSRARHTDSAASNSALLFYCVPARKHLSLATHPFSSYFLKHIPCASYLSFFDSGCIETTETRTTDPSFPMPALSRQESLVPLTPSLIRHVNVCQVRCCRERPKNRAYPLRAAANKWLTHLSLNSVQCNKNVAMLG